MKNYEGENIYRVNFEAFDMELKKGYIYMIAATSLDAKNDADEFLSLWLDDTPMRVNYEDVEAQFLQTTDVYEIDLDEKREKQLRDIVEKADVDAYFNEFCKIW